MKIAIIGGGFVGSTVYNKLKQNHEVDIFSTFENHAASRAAGAMINVLAEREFHTHDVHEHRFKYEWAKIVAQKLVDDVVTDLDAKTRILRPRENKSEQLNYDLITSTIKGRTSILDEYSFTVTTVDCKNISLFDEKNYDRIIYCVGSNINDYFPNIRKVISSKGLAIYVDSNVDILELDNEVIRTANRGNRCGFHVIRKRSKHYYVGATAELSHNNKENISTQKIASLLNQLHTYFPEVKFQYSGYVYGHRPYSVDGLPVIGPIDDRNFVVSGTNREGITVSYGIADIVENWVEGTPQTSLANTLLRYTDPLRSPNECFTKNEMRDIAEIMCGKTITSWPKEKVYTPEMLLYYLGITND